MESKGGWSLREGESKGRGAGLELMYRDQLPAIMGCHKFKPSHSSCFSETAHIEQINKLCVYVLWVREAFWLNDIPYYLRLQILVSTKFSNLKSPELVSWSQLVSKLHITLQSDYYITSC